MYAIVRLNQFDPGKVGDATADFSAFDTLHSAQPGYAGNAAIELGPGQWLTVTFWDDEPSATAARLELGKHAERLLGPLMTGPSRLLGVGRVVRTDLERTTTA